MFNFLKALGGGSRLKKSEASETQNPITQKILDKHIKETDPKYGNVFNILFSSDDIEKYDSDIIEMYLSKGADKFQALEFALINEKYQQAEKLFVHLKFNNSSILGAIHNKSLILLQYFVEKKGANVNLHNEYDYDFTPLKLAAKLEEPHKTKITNYLLEKGAIPSNTNLEEAIQNNQIKTQNDILTTSEFFKALREKDFNVIKKLVEKDNFNVNTTYLDATPLSIAINLENREQIIKYLLEHGANPDSAIAAAAMEGNLQGIKTLIQAGVAINPINSEPPLMLAAERGHVETVELLLENGVKPNVQGWKNANLYNDIMLQLNLISEAREKINNFNDFNILKSIVSIMSMTTLSSYYTKYNNLSLEQLQKEFFQLQKQINQDFQNFNKIANLLKDYSNPKETKLEENTTISDQNCILNTSSELTNEEFHKTSLTGQLKNPEESLEDIFDLEL